MLFQTLPPFEQLALFEPLFEMPAYGMKQKIFVWGMIGVNGYIFSRWQAAENKFAAQKGRIGTIDASKTRFMNDNFVLSKRNTEAGRWWTLVTSEFSHKDPIHFLFNMMAFHGSAKLAFELGLGIPRSELSRLGHHATMRKI